MCYRSFLSYAPLHRSMSVLSPALVLLCFVSAVAPIPASSQALQPWPDEYFKSDTEQNTKFLRAAYNGSVAELRRLAKDGADIDAKPTSGGFVGQPAICFALFGLTRTRENEAGHQDTVLYLVDHGANLSACDLTQLVHRPATLRLLLQHGLDPRIPTGWGLGGRDGSALGAAIFGFSGDPQNVIESVKLLLSAGVNANALNSGGENVLHSLFWSTVSYPRPATTRPRQYPHEADFRELVALLVRNGANVNQATEYFGDQDCGPPTLMNGVSSCLTWDTSKNICNLPMRPCVPERMKLVKPGVTPLIKAASWAYGILLVKALLASGADSGLKDSSGCTAFDLSATPSIRQVLLSYHHPAMQESKLPEISSTCKIGSTNLFAVGVDPDSAENVSLDKIDYLCYKSPTVSRASVKTTAASSFGNARVLDLSIQDDAKLLSPDAVTELTREVLFAVSLWRRMCVECSLANAAVVQIGPKIYVDERLVGILSSIDYQNSTLTGMPITSSPGPPNADTLRALYANAGIYRSVTLGKYLEVDKSDRDIERLCQAEPDKVPFDLSGVWAAFHCGPPKSGIRTALRINILKGFTACGKLLNIVGCEVRGTEIQLNAHEFTFVRHITSKPVFGTGRFYADLQTLLLHEAGHWAGIHRHSTTPGSIMSAYLEECKCINFDVIKSLAAETTSPSRGDSLSLLMNREEPPSGREIMWPLTPADGSKGYGRSVQR
jgi:hypothetical protein